MKKIILILALLLIPTTLANAQSQRNPCYNTALANGNQNCVPVGTSTPLPVTGTFTPSGTQTVTGTVTANQGTANTTANSWPFKITDGVNGPATVGTSGQDGLASVNLLAVLNQNMLWNGSTLSIQRDMAGASLNTGFGVASTAIRATSSTNAGITPVVSASAEATHVLKASAGNLYSVFAANHTATAGFLVILNATSAPADGAITPLECAALPANGNASINYNPGPASSFSTGITAVLTSAANCFTKTTGVITGFIRGSVQ